MKILHIISSLEIGGAQRLLSDILPLMARNHEVTLLVNKEVDNDFSRKVKAEGVNVIPCGCEKLHSLKNIIKIAKFAKGYDIVHVHLFPTIYWAAFASVFPRVLTGRKSSILMEISAGLLLFAGIILLPDEVTAPKGKISRLLYGAVGGIICMIIRHFGAFEEGACYAVLIMNALSPFFDKERIPNFLKRSPQKQEEGGEVKS